MEPTKAPWAVNKSASAIPTSLPVRQPAALLIDAQPALPPAAPPTTDAQTPAFREPRPCITSQAALTQFLKSDTARSFVGFILALGDAVKALVSALQQLSGYVDDIPPHEQTLRYGNPAYREWFDRMAAAAPTLLASVVPPTLHPALTELVPYFVHSFGNRTRIDYGTGHETTFCALLYCLAVLGVVGADDCQALVTRVYATYLRLMRNIQTTYWLEPAGSHGVWGLDDYQFLSFVWGAAQLINHPMMRPSSIHNTDIISSYASEYLYLDSVAFVLRVKKGPLAETSPMINDISGVPSWAKVHSGLVKMYQAELLAKLPIMQHFLFGSLLPFPGKQ